MNQQLLEEEPLDIAQIIQQLRSKDAAVRESLERTLVARKTEGLQLVLDIIQQEVRKRKQRTIWSNILFNLGMLPFASIGWLAHLIDSVLFFLCYICLSMAFVFLVVFICILLRSASRVEKHAVSTLARFDTLDVLGPLLEAQETWAGTKEESVVSSHLKALLPRMRRSDAALLNAEQRRTLYWILMSSRDSELVLAILKALEQIGDSQALPYVEKLATGQVKTTGTAVGATRGQIRRLIVNANMLGRTFTRKEEQRIQKAAMECLPFLQEQASAGQQTLLRAADPLSQPTATLLRPSASTSELSPQEMLRAHSPEEQTE